MCKRLNIKYGKLPAKVAEEMPWNKILLDLVKLIDHMDLKIPICFILKVKEITLTLKSRYINTI